MRNLKTDLTGGILMTSVVCSENNSRILFLDNLKSFIVCLMIAFHVATCYMLYAPDGWYVVDKTNPQLFFLLFVLWADVFIVPVMFFLSGYFAIKSLGDHTARYFWKNKLLKVGIPWVLGVVLFAAPVTYLTLLSRGIDIPYGQFANRIFLFGPQFSHIQYWLLGVLLLLYIVLFLASRFFPGLIEQKKPSAPGIKMFLVLAITSYIFTAGSYTLAHSNSDQWCIVWPILVFQPTRIALHVIYFILGAYAWRSQWFAKGTYKADPAKWLPAFIVLSIIYLWYIMFGKATGASPFQFMMFREAWHVLLLMSAVFGLLAIFQSKLDYSNKLMKIMTKNSHTMYFAHLEIVLPLAWYFTGIELPVYIKFAVVCLLGMAGTFAVGRMLLILPFFKTNS